MVGYPSGQRGETVNLLGQPYGGSNPPPTTILILGQNYIQTFQMIWKVFL